MFPLRREFFIDPQVGLWDIKTMMLSVRGLLLLLSLWAFVFSVPSALAEKVAVQLQERRVYDFKQAGVRFSNLFPGARLNDCTQEGDTAFRVLVRPENFPVNDSAWYAFQVVASEPKTITVTLAYENGKHRYQPKISFDGVNWQPLATFTQNRQANEATLTFEVGPIPLTIAAQEMIGVAEIESWMSEVARKSFVKKSLVGRSLGQLPIHQIEIQETKEPNYVFIIGRQHPPEVTGTLGLMQFTETLAGSSSLARKFRQQFRTVVIPLVNPDGVNEGNWRHNLNGVDLNRDWNKFAQPETRAVRDHLLRLAGQKEARVFAMFDFHSTQKDVFYTETDREKIFPDQFTRRWLDALQTRFPDYEVRRDASHSPDGNTSKVWSYEQFHCSSITYEFGDTTERARIREISHGAAEEMMRLLLEAVAP